MALNYPSAEHAVTDEAREQEGYEGRKRNIYTCI